MVDNAKLSERNFALGRTLRDRALELSSMDPLLGSAGLARQLALVAAATHPPLGVIDGLRETAMRLATLGVPGSVLAEIASGTVTRKLFDLTTAGVQAGPLLGNTGSALQMALRHTTRSAQLGSC